MFLLWLRQLLLCGDWTPASVPHCHGQVQSHSVLFFPLVPSSYRALCGSVYSFPLVRYSCPLSAGILYALLCLKVYFWCFVEGDVLCIHLLLCHLVLTSVKWFFQPSFSSQIFVWDLAQNFLADFSYKQHKGYKRSYQNRSLLRYDNSVSRRWPGTPWLLSSPKPLLWMLCFLSFPSVRTN